MDRTVLVASLALLLGFALLAARALRRSHARRAPAGARAFWAHLRDVGPIGLPLPERHHRRRLAELIAVR